MFVDRVKIKVRGGKGGAGGLSFLREKFMPKGGPDGGDGGAGGDVILKATVGESSLIDLYYMNHYEGGNGVRGNRQNQNGARGATKVVKVPCGTVVRDAETGELLEDLDHDGQEFVAAQGGRGGRGNRRFMTSTNRVPRQFDLGDEGDERELNLELKIISDVGLVGYPNAGKSTLLTEISDAHPKTAPYPFTTMHPNVGVVEFPDFYRFTVADIPGLIDGAHENVGLGHAFLRHIERAGILIYVLDMAGTDGRKPWDDMEALKRELDLYLDGLSNRVALIVANKMDEDESEENLALLREKTTLPIIPTIAPLQQNTDVLVAELRKLLETQAEAKVAEAKLAEAKALEAKAAEIKAVEATWAEVDRAAENAGEE
jgi:GTP-binding protein